MGVACKAGAVYLNSRPSYIFLCTERFLVVILSGWQGKNTTDQPCIHVGVLSKPQKEIETLKESLSKQMWCVVLTLSLSQVILSSVSNLCYRDHFLMGACVW